ncbi:50S ribosomal protein L33 [Patescibacteria group bacterium]
MSQDHLVKLQCNDCKKINYYTTRNKKKVPDKLELKKFCKNCKKHTPHKEMKK